jgi:hypothetical protein
MQTRLVASNLIPSTIVVRQLGRAGLKVTPNMLRLDIQDEYLPHPQRDPRGFPEGTQWLWEPWALRRALYLYRLRRRGMKGDLLRVFLFLRDGWGWARVQTICVKGQRKLISAQMAPVRRHTHSINAKTVTNLMQEIAADADVHIPTGLYVYGLGLFGSPLPGASALPIVNAIQTFFEPISDPPIADFAGLIATSVQAVMVQAGLTFDRELEITQQTDAELADRVRTLFNEHMRTFRRSLQFYARRDGVRGRSTNPLSMFGTSPKELDQELRSMPMRVTRAQMLGAALACMILPAHLMPADQMAAELEHLIELHERG